MKIKSGETIAYEFVNLMRNHIERNYFYINNLETIERFVADKIKQEYFEILLNEPIILYARKGSLKDPEVSSGLNEHIDKVINYNNVHVLIALITLAPGTLKKLNVKWIIIEEENSNKDLPYNLGLLLRMISPDDKVVGKSSYKLLENFAADELEYNYVGFQKKSDAFFLNLHNVKDVSAYEISAFKYRDIYAKKIPDEDKNKIFKYSCPICEKEFKVSLSSGKNDKYKMLDELLIVEQDSNKKMINFNCNHEKTDYYNKYKKFGLNIDKYKNLSIESKEDKDIIFLYMFDNFKSDQDKTKFLKNKQNEVIITKSAFLSKSIKEKEKEKDKDKYDRYDKYEEIEEPYEDDIDEYE